jgi:hypothetical protein
MKLTELLYEMALYEMARSDLKGSEESLKNKNWKKVAAIYVKNMRADDKTDDSIIRSLGSTFRTKSDGKIHISKDIILDKDEANELKKAIKDELGFVPKSKEKKVSNKKDDKVVEEPEEKKVEENTRYFSKSIKQNIINMKNAILK